MSLDGLQPGDVLAVTEKPWWNPFSMAIRLGSLMAHHPTFIDHIVVFHHTDEAGVPWGIEGRPGGVGWADLRQYDNRWLRSNRQEVKTPSDRALICSRMEKLLGVGYDWVAIAADGVIDASQGAATVDFSSPPGATPQHVVCSSAAAWAYAGLGLVAPKTLYRICQPFEWWELFREYGWR
jgi:hypothetical protein